MRPIKTLLLAGAFVGAAGFAFAQGGATAALAALPQSAGRRRPRSGSAGLLAVRHRSVSAPAQLAVPIRTSTATCQMAATAAI